MLVCIDQLGICAKAQRLRHTSCKRISSACAHVLRDPRAAPGRRPRPRVRVRARSGPKKKNTAGPLYAGKEDQRRDHPAAPRARLPEETRRWAAQSRRTHARRRAGVRGRARRRPVEARAHGRARPAKHHVHRRHLGERSVEPDVGRLQVPQVRRLRRDRIWHLRERPRGREELRLPPRPARVAVLRAGLAAARGVHGGHCLRGPWPRPDVGGSRALPVPPERRGNQRRARLLRVGVVEWDGRSDRATGAAPGPQQKTLPSLPTHHA